MSKPDWKDKAKKAAEQADEAAGKLGKPNFMDSARKKADKVIDDAAEKVSVGKPDFIKKAVDSVHAEAKEVVEEVAGSEEEEAGGLPAEHEVVSGDNLSFISKRYYGTPNNWKAIYEANKDVIKDPNVIRAGMVLKIPKLD